MRVRTDFPGASLGEHALAGGRLVASLRREALVRVDGFCYDYNCHFAFGLENDGAAPAAVEVLINADERTPMPGPALIYAAPAPDAEFRPAALDARSDGRRGYRLRAEVPPRSSLYLANYYFRLYDGLVRRFDALAEATGAVRETFGKTVQGRDLTAYHYPPAPGAPADPPAILVTSGMHPPESDTVACEAIMELLGGPAGAALRRTFAVTVVPLANPDGFALGLNGCNACEINFFWDFAAEDRDRCPEAHALWALIERLRPVAYLDFHGYTFQLAKEGGPYLKPAILYEGRAVRRAVRRLDAALLALSGGHAVRGILTYSPSMLASRLTRRLNTITYAKYHLHLKDGIARNREIAVEVLARVAAGLEAAGLTRPADVLKRPWGAVGVDPWSRAGAALTRLWGLRARPLIGAVARRVRAAGSAA